MNLSHENRLLLYCVQTKIPEDTLDKVKNLLSLPLNWEDVLEYAFWYGIAPLVYHNLKGLQENHTIPQDVMEQLKGAYQGNLARNMYLYIELKRILDAFREKGVEVIILKGAALAKIVYGDIGLRPMGDIDLLVKGEDIPHAKEIMSSLSYIHSENSKSEEWYKENHFHLPVYIHPDKSIIVEIHWHIIGNSFYYIDINEWWERARVVTMTRYQALAPSPEDMLIHLCLHLFTDGNILLRGICDIFEVLRYYREEINWNLFQDKVNKYGIEKPVYSILFFVKKIQDDNENSLSWLDTNLVDLKLLSLIEKRIFNKDENHCAIPQQLVQLHAMDKLWDKVRILLERIFPPREEMSNRYSVPLYTNKIYFYYVIRPFQLLLKYGKIVLDIFRYPS